jgi:hypothetical protein
MGADVVALNASAWGGPPVGALVFRNPAMLDQLPSVALEPGARGAERMELGPHAYPLLAGLVSSVDYLAGLDDAAVGPRRDRLLTSLGSVKAYQAGLLANLTNGLRRLRHVMVIGDAMRRVPSMAFTVTGVKAEDAIEHLSDGVCAPSPTPARTACSRCSGSARSVVPSGLVSRTTRTRPRLTNSSVPSPNWARRPHPVLTSADQRSCGRRSVAVAAEEQFLQVVGGVGDEREGIGELVDVEVLQR